MDQYELIRTAKRVYKKSIRQISRETGHTRKTIRKVLQGLEPKYRRKEEPGCAVMDPVAAMVEGWLKADQQDTKNKGTPLIGFIHGWWKKKASRAPNRRCADGFESGKRGWA